MKKKRIISLIAALIVTLSGILMLPTTYAKAQEPEVTGYWELVDVYDEQSDSLERVSYEAVEVLSGSAASGFTDVCTLTVDGYRYSYTLLDDRLHDGSCNGETGTAVFTFSPLPGSRLTPGEELAITANVSCSTSPHHVGVSGRVYISYLFSTSPGSSNVYFRTEDRGTSISPELIWQAEGSHSGGHTDSVGDSSGTYSATIPDGGGSRTDLYIEFSIHFGVAGCYINSFYHYQWVDTTPVASEQTEADDDHEPTIYITESENADEDTADSDNQTENDSDEAEPEDTGPIVQTVTQNADSDSGEDNGTDIITAIVLGVGGALATAGAVGASSGGKKDGGDEEEKKRKTYRMKVYKNFGDSIQKGAKAVYVWARIVEITDGGEENRPDLSEKITVSGTGMDVRSAGMQNTYMGAEVSVPADSQAQTATLTFTFTGEGGVFRNNIVFQVLGEPEITFPAVSEDGQHWDVNSQNNQVDLIAGARVSERLRFVITNASEEPKAIRFTADREGLDVTWEKDTQWQYTYYACIENRTAPIEKENGIFADMISASVRIDAEFENGLTIWSYIIIRLFPEGLSAQGKLENGRLTVNTLPLENPTEGFAKISPTVFSVTLAYLDRNGHTVVPGEPCWTPRALTDDGKYGLMFTENFKYTVKYQSASEVAFYPEVTLPMPGDPYEARMELAAETDDGSFRAELPMIFYGDKPAKRTDDQREQALQELRNTVRFFGAGTDETTRALLHSAKDQTAEELAVTRQWIILTSTEYYKNEKQEFESIDRYMSRMIIVSNAFIFMGDKAVTFLLSRMAGPLGKEASNILNPLKNMLAEFIGDCIGDMVDGTPVDLNANRVYKFYLQSVDSLLTNVMTGGLKPKGDTLGYVAATYLLNRFAYNYFYGARKIKGDVYRSACAAFGDLTLMFFKAWIEDLFKEKLKKGLADWGEALAKWTGSEVIVPWLAEVLLRRGLRSVRHKGEHIAGDQDKLDILDSDTEGLMVQSLEFYVKAIFKEAFDITVDDVYEVAGDALREQMQTFVQIEGSTLKLNVYGVVVTIPLVTNNIGVFINMFFDFAFGWMKDIWKNNDPQQFLPPNVPDLMDNPETDEGVVGRQMERVRNLQPTVPTVSFDPTK